MNNTGIVRTRDDEEEDDRRRLRKRLSSDMRIVSLREALECAGIGGVDEIVKKCERKFKSTRRREECVMYVIAYTLKGDDGKTGFIYERVNDVLRGRGL